MTASFPRQGEFWLAALDPTVGSEIQKTRPVMIVSNDALNRTVPPGLSIVVPVTTTPGRSLHVPVVIPDQQLARKSYLMPEQIRTISHERLVKRLSDPVPDACSEVRKRIRILLSDD